jgi:hypothetical protein
LTPVMYAHAHHRVECSLWLRTATTISFADGCRVASNLWNIIRYIYV